MTTNEAKIEAFPVFASPAPLRKASTQRDWMDDTRYRFAYRCLPLVIANGIGWEVLCPYGFSARWNGGVEPDAIHIEADESPERPFVMTHFGEGVLTFHPGHLFRTPEDTELFVSGPLNAPKDGIAALSGVVESAWLPFPFTMNWLFTRVATTVRFEAGEPFCQLFPIRLSAIEGMVPVKAALEDHPDLQQRSSEWTAARQAFLDALPTHSSEAPWQRDYMQGRYPTGERTTARHRTKVHMCEFADAIEPGERSE